MSRKFVMLVDITEVIPAEPIRERNGYVAKVNIGSGMAAVATTERQKVEHFKLVLTADTEQEAYRKVIKLLEANRPEPVRAVFGDEADPVAQQTA